MNPLSICQKTVKVNHATINYRQAWRTMRNGIDFHYFIGSGARWRWPIGAMGANRQQTLKSFIEAGQHKGPSLVMCYSPCIAHGIDMMYTQVEEKRAVDCGYWPLYRYNPSLEKPFVWETPEPKEDFISFIKSERRYSTLTKAAPADAERLFELAKTDAARRMNFLKKIGEIM